MSGGFFWSLIVLIGVSAAGAETVENYRADLFKLGENAYRLYRESSVTEAEDGQSTTHNVYYYGAGPDQTAIEEKVYYQDGRLKNYLVLHHQLREDWQTLIDGERVVFRKRDWDSGESEEGSEQLVDNFVVAPMIVPYLQKNWRKILAGETVYVRFGVPARKETVGFKLFKDGEAELNGEPVIVIKMKPSSFFIALLVDPLYMYLKKDGNALVRFKGRNFPRKLIDGRWKDADYDTYFHNISSDFRGVDSSRDSADR